MNIQVISDTHEKHQDIIVPECDILIHCGDFTNFGNRRHIGRFLNWFAKQPAEHKLFICGNHEKSLCRSNPDFDPTKILMIADFLDLSDNHYELFFKKVEINGVKVWGAPITKFIRGYWGFEYTEPQIESLMYELNEGDCDILITHSPAYGILDNGYGSVEILNAINRIKPKLHLCGHIHETRGFEKREGVWHVNAATYETPISIDFTDGEVTNIVEYP